MKIYISGPITGTDDYWERFREAEKEINRRGHEGVNPARLDRILNPETTTHDQYMSACLGILAICDAIYIMPGSEKSKGAMEELETATMMEMPVFRKLHHIPRKYRRDAREEGEA